MTTVLEQTETYMTALRSTYELSVTQEAGWESKVVHARDSVLLGGHPGQITVVADAAATPAAARLAAEGICGADLAGRAFAAADSFRELAPRLARHAWAALPPLQDGLRLAFALRLTAQLGEGSFSVLTMETRFLRPGHERARAVCGLAAAFDPAGPGLFISEGKGVDLDQRADEQAALIGAWRQALLTMEDELLPLLEDPL
jgi:hypothetical protein